MSPLTPHQSKALDRKHHISLTANAGSGKTFVLTKRYLEIALKEDVSLREMAAITFTEKAASELYKKISDTITELLLNETDKKQIKKLTGLRQSLISANIQTIHSFCIDILKEYPVEAGIDANFSPIDPEKTNELIELAIEETVKAAVEEGEYNDTFKYLVRVFGSISIFKDQLKDLIYKRKKVELIGEELYKKTDDEIATYYEQNIEEAAKEILKETLATVISDLKILNNYATEANSKLAPEIDSLLSGVESEKAILSRVKVINSIFEKILTSDGKKVRSRGYLNKSTESCLKEIDRVLQHKKEIAAFHLPDNHKEQHKALALFGKRLYSFYLIVLDAFERRKTDNGFLDFEDILLHTMKILKNEDVRFALSQKYKYIMVDEYQDTNEIQYQIFLPILNDLKNAGNLFVVGDEKQSIYMFRDAELAVFQQTKEDIKQVDGEEYLLSLPASFRMAPAICGLTNYMFRKLFENPKDIFNEVEHTDLICGKSDELHGEIEVLVGVDKPKEEDLVEGEEIPSEAEMVARRLITLHEDGAKPVPLEWKDMAVLCRKRNSFAELEEVFFEHNIPYTIVGGKGFYQRQMVFDISNYFQFLIYENNDAALAGILRSPFFSLSDSDLYSIWLQRKGSLWNCLQQCAHTDKRIEAIVTTLHENRALAATMGIAELLRKIVRETGYLTILASRSDGAQEMANFEKLLRLTIAYSNQGFRNLYDYVMFLQHAIESMNDEGQAAIIDESDTVRIMTVHQSKGLEFKAVVLFKCNVQAQKTVVKQKGLEVNKQFGFITKLPDPNNFAAKYFSPPIADLHQLIEQKKEIAEIKRLFYVAVTRAKNYLFFSYDTSAKSFDTSFISLLKYAFHIDEFADDIKIAEELETLQLIDDEFVTDKTNIEVDVSIIRSIQKRVLLKETQEGDSKKNVDVSKIEDLPSGEIVSASKLAVFRQCPMKYQLTYDFGLSTLYSQYRDWKQAQLKNRFEYQLHEDSRATENSENATLYSTRSNADVKGRIIHSILQHNIALNELEEFIKRQLDLEMNSIHDETQKKEHLLKDILIDIEYYYESNTHAELKKYKNYFHEYEIYTAEGDYYLYGIIDKLVIDGDKIIIVDYKTDAIEKDAIEKRGEHYKTQLLFYAYTIGKMYPQHKECQLRIVFIKHPDVPYIYDAKTEDKTQLQENLTEMMKTVRSKAYTKNIHHCPECLFSINHRDCVL